MKHEALRELRSIIRVGDWAGFCPEKLREELLNEWIERWIVDVEYSQSVVSTSYLNGEYLDLIKEKLGQGMAEDLVEDCINYKVDNKKVAATMCGLRRRAK